MEQLSPEQLIRAGVHYGHDTSRWNPKMKPYIFSSKNKIHIIDIRETIRGLIVAKEFLKNVVAGGEDVLFVGTKYQARELLRRKAEENDVPYVVDRWLGGTLTNFKTIRSRLNRLEEIEQWEEDGTLDLYSKKEQSAILREKRKLIRNLGGIRDLDELPGAMVVIDPLMEEIAVSEANREDIPIVALIDTDGDPSKVDVPVPCNDEAMRVIDMMVDELIAAVKEGQEKQAQIYEEQQQKKQQEQKQQSSSDEQQQEDTSSEAQNESDRSEDEGENSDAADASDNAEPSTPAQEEEATA
jgi:small subunit ribosomal protein S2